jgi:hypothetical protein
MTGYRLEQINPDYWLVMRGSTKVAIVFPDSSDRFLVYPHPDTYPGLTFEGLPKPFLPEWMTFGSIVEVERFLGIEQEKEAA